MALGSSVEKLGKDESGRVVEWASVQVRAFASCARFVKWCWAGVFVGGRCSSWRSSTIRERSVSACEKTSWLSGTSRIWDMSA